MKKAIVVENKDIKQMLAEKFKVKEEAISNTLSAPPRYLPSPGRQPVGGYGERERQLYPEKPFIHQLIKKRRNRTCFTS